jgi:hypothetical protein
MPRSCQDCRDARWCPYTAQTLKAVLQHMESAHPQRWRDLELYPPVASGGITYVHDFLADRTGTQMTITELSQAYEKSLTTSLEDRVFTVVGTIDVGHAPQYGDHLYVDLIEGTSKIRVYIRAEDRALNGRRVEASGRLKRNVRLLNGTISLTLYATRLKVLETLPQEWTEPLAAVGMRRQQQWPSIEQAVEQRLRAGTRLRLWLILGVGAEIGEDISETLEAHAGAYAVTEERGTVSDVTTAVAALRSPKSDVDLIALVGGGGDWLRVLSSREVCTAVAELSGPPIVSGVGHAGNHLSFPKT